MTEFTTSLNTKNLIVPKAGQIKMPAEKYRFMEWY